ncbi:MAG: AAA family ATPase [Firmicutes bacterium]|nr:AAA family ATPase [Bacillota bacterium]
MTKKFRIKMFNNDGNFPKNNLDIWVSSDIYSDFANFNGNEIDRPVYVKVSTAALVGENILYAILQPSNDADENIAYISKDIEHSTDVYFLNNEEVTIEPIEYDNFVQAEQVTISLKSEEVYLWSAEEVSNSENSVLTNNKIVFLNQIMWINPFTIKQKTLAKVIDIFPRNPDNPNIAYQTTNKTKIIFEGLPESQQKVIDFNKIGGLNDVIIKIREIVQIPLHFPELLEKFGIVPPRGLLLYGPPGNGKTMIARAVADNMGARFFSIEGSQLLSKFVGVGEQKLEDLFNDAAKAAEKGNAIIFIDELDSMAMRRDKYDVEHNITMVGRLLSLMDGIHSRRNVFVIGATNRLNTIDSAFRRPGRFELEFEIPNPNLNARYDILTKYVDISNNEIIAKEVDNNFLSQISELTNGYSGADISSLYRQAVMNAMRKAIDIDSVGKLLLKHENVTLTKDDFEVARKSITPTSLRGVDVPPISTSWDEIIGLCEPKENLLKIHDYFSANTEVDTFGYRPDFLNLIFKGDIGSGRKTLVKAFATGFNYELLPIDLLNLFTLGYKEAFNAIDETFLKAKQVAPSIIYISNLQNIDKADLFLHKLLNNTRQLNARHKILIIVEIDNKGDIPNNLIGYKAFQKPINFEWQPEELSQIFDKYNVDNETGEHLIKEHGITTTGHLISKLKNLQFQ